MTERDDDATVWIAYSDLMTTLVVLFFLLFAAALTRSRVGDALLRGSVRDARSGTALAGCTVRLGIAREDRTVADGAFGFRLTELRASTPLEVRVECAGYGRYDDTVRVAPGDTTELPVILRPLQTVTPSDSAITIRVVPGDALFDVNDYRLRPKAVDYLREIGLDLKSRLGPGQVVAVEGHTDDKPFPPSADKDNWVLSGERAASAARILTHPAYGVGLRECQVLIIGRGPGLPRRAIAPDDTPDERARKRAENRRIEFRILQGAEMAGGECGAE